MKKKKNVVRRHPFLLMAVLLAVGYSVYHWQVTQTKLDGFLQIQETLKTEIEDHEDEIDRLENEYAYSQTEEAVERIAREKLKMVKPNEIIYWIKGLNEEGGNGE